jgi:quercetin dioxygenase-like cupin family protein
MKKLFIAIAVSVLALTSLVFAQADKGKKAGHAQMGTTDAHVLMSADEVKFGPAPPSLPPGAQFALLEGDPTRAGGEYTIRAKLPDGYKIPPHWHPVTENVTVIQGSLYFGMGDKFDDTAGKELPAGGFASMPKGVRHFAWAKGETVIQVHGVGPFEIVYVNPADDPRKKPNAK